MKQVYSIIIVSEKVIQNYFSGGIQDLQVCLIDIKGMILVIIKMFYICFLFYTNSYS